MTNEAFSRVKIDAQLRDQGWEITNTNAVRFEYVLPDRTKADYVLCDRNGRSLSVVEAKKAAINPAEAEAQAKAYAAQLKVSTSSWPTRRSSSCRLLPWRRSSRSRTLQPEKPKQRSDRGLRRHSQRLARRYTVRWKGRLRDS